MSSNENDTGRTIRIVMFPWLAYGHITPYLELAKKLTTKHSFIVYMCSTPATLTCIDKKVPQNSNSIKLVPFHLPTTQGLPSNFHTTNGLSSHLIPTLTKALDSSAKEFSEILDKLVPDLVIYDCFQPWAASVAKDRNIPAVEFITSGAASTSHLYHQLLHPGIEFPFSKDIYHRDYDDKTWLLATIASPERTKNVLEGARVSDRIVLIKGCRDIEGKYIDYLSSLTAKKHVPVGPLVILESSSNPNDGRDEEIMSWLDKREKKSTVFVSFGSECFITKEDICEVAYGLELSKSNFIWVVRLPKGDNDNVSSIDEILPQGFLDRVKGRGRVLEGWAPQTKILGHANCGGFVSHCGWNSVMESMYFGVPIIAMPMHVDQPVNARLVEEIGVGVEVLRDKNKRFRRETLAEVIRRVVMEGSGSLVRERAAQMKEKLRHNGSEEIDQVVKELLGLLQ